MVVDILEGGVDFAHAAIQPRAWTNKKEIAGNGKDDDNNGYVDDVHGYNFTANTGTVTPNHPHPTHVAAIASRGTHAIEIMSTRAGDGTAASKWGEAIDYAANNGARVINFSYLMDKSDEIEAVRSAIHRHPNVLFVLAAGNTGKELGSKGHGEKEWSSAMKASNVMVISSVDGNGALAANSDWGKRYSTLAARGVDVTSAVPGDKYETWSGTSMASPQVANAAAKVLVLAPQLAPHEVRRLLVLTADHVLTDKTGGVLNKDRALKVAALCGLAAHMSVESAARKIGADPALVQVAKLLVGG